MEIVNVKKKVFWWKERLFKDLYHLTKNALRMGLENTLDKEEIVKENEETKHLHNNPGPGVICFDLGPDMPLSVTRVGKLPQVRDIFIFPAWLQHHVNAFKSDVERISVSGNLKFIEIDKTQLPTWLHGRTDLRQ